VSGKRKPVIREQNIILIIKTGNTKCRGIVYKISHSNSVKNLPPIEVPQGHIFGDYQG
jgi:hypothetical protein